MKISVVIAVAVEEVGKLRDCVNSVKDFADEVVIFGLDVDEETVLRASGSVDIKIIKSSKPKYIETLRNKMVDSTSGEWILILDPDERLNSALAKKLADVVNGGKYSVVNIPRKNIFFGKWIAHTSWWPDRQLRFFERGALVWSNTIHKYPEARGEVLSLPAKSEYAISHFGFDTLNEFVARHNRYSTAEADGLNNAGVKFNVFQLLWQPTREFTRRYFRHLGFRDGFWGFALSYLMAYYKFTVWVKLWHLQEK